MVSSYIYEFTNYCNVQEIKTSELKKGGELSKKREWGKTDLFVLQKRSKEQIIYVLETKTSSKRHELNKHSMTLYVYTVRYYNVILIIYFT